MLLHRFIISACFIVEMIKAAEHLILLQIKQCPMRCKRKIKFIYLLGVGGIISFAAFTHVRSIHVDAVLRAASIVHRTFIDIRATSFIVSGNVTFITLATETNNDRIKKKNNKWHNYFKRLKKAFIENWIKVCLRHITELNTSFKLANKQRFVDSKPPTLHPPHPLP